MIVVWGVPGDGPLDAVLSGLSRRGAAFRLLDQREAARSTVDIRFEGARLLMTIEGSSASSRLDFDEIRAIYLRPIETARALPPGTTVGSVSEVRAQRLDRAIIEWADMAPVLVINPPAAMAVNNSKPHQLRLVSRYGFDVPDTLVTTDPVAVRAFARRHGRLIYKSVSGTRSIVTLLDDAAMDRVDTVANAPTQFQEFVPGVDVRVHVVGRESFATEISSDAHDYRYASREGHDVQLSPTTLPSEVEERCRVMAAGMGLAVAGIDLRRTPEGRWVCFEVNPSPAFVYYEAATGQPIGDAIARLLIGADGARR